VRPWVKARARAHPTRWLRVRINWITAWGSRHEGVPEVIRGHTRLALRARCTTDRYPGLVTGGSSSRLASRRSEWPSDRDHRVPSVRVQRAVHGVKHLGLIDLTPLRTFTRTELVDFQAALRSEGGIQTTTERVIDRLITRQWREDTLRHSCGGRPCLEGTERQRLPGTPACIIVVMLMAAEILAIASWRCCEKRQTPKGAPGGQREVRAPSSRKRPPTCEGREATDPMTTRNFGAA
jgi:hypothetical protein